MTLPSRMRAFSIDSTASSDTLSILDVEHLKPERFLPIQTAYNTVKTKALSISQTVYATFTHLNSSFFTVFALDELLAKLKATSITNLTKQIAPYISALGLLYMTFQLENEMAHFEAYIAALSVAMIAYLLQFKITELRPSSHVLETTLCLYALGVLHVLSFKEGLHVADYSLQSFLKDDYISYETYEGLSILSAIISTLFLMPQGLLTLSSLIDKVQKKKDERLGLKTQISKTALLPRGKVKELNFALNLYDHLNSQLKDKARLFQYFIVSLNVLKDTLVQDPLTGELMKKRGWSKFVHKTRNLWLLAADSFIKAKADMTFKLRNIDTDLKANLQQFTVIRNGQRLEGVYRFELKTGDLVPLEEALLSATDPQSGVKRQKTQLCGYLIQAGALETKKVVISLVELNGENHPLILEPARRAKDRQELKSIDLFDVTRRSCILPGIEILSFDNKDHSATAEGLYLQIASGSESSHRKIQKTPKALQDAKKLKDDLIVQSLALSALVSAPLINYSDAGNLAYYSTQMVDKFTQVFSELQQIIPLVSEVTLEMIHRELLKKLNRGISEPFELNDALLVADLFEALRLNRVKIYSDKTGTVTENVMIVRNACCLLELKKAMALAFFTSFSDQKTEVEENQIREFLASHLQQTLSLAAGSGPGFFKKTLTDAQGSTHEFESYKLGLISDYGGQFSLRKDTHGYFLVFCGIPRELSFEALPLLASYQTYLEKQALNERGECLSRDWCVAEKKISKEDFDHFFELFDIKDQTAFLDALKLKLSAHLKDLSYLGTFQIDNPIKKGAKKAIASFKEAGIGFKLITGDTKAACCLVAKKLFEIGDDKIFMADDLLQEPIRQSLVDEKSCVIFTATSMQALDLMDELEDKKSKAPYIIFSQTKDIDKQIITQHGKQKGEFVIASGDGCNDLLMFDSCDLAIASSAHDGTFARGTHEACNLTDLQIQDLMGDKDATIYELFDIHKKQNSHFLKKFAKLANTSPKVITALLGKPLKNIAIPRLLGWGIQEIPMQFGLLLGYDALFIAMMYRACIHSSNTPLLVGRVSRSKLPYTTLITSVALASLQSLYCFYLHNRQITTPYVLITNLALSALCFEVFLTPGGYKK